MTRRVRLSDSLGLPLDVVTQRVSILGRTRSGKSHTAGVIVEEVLKARQQTVILDPKGDWWGLRSSADGKSAGLPITIMGGKHGDIPLEPTAGALVADVVVNEGISVVLDLSLFESKADEIRFVTAFLDRLYRKNTRPVLLVIDEADTFAPQRPEKNETVMLNRMETICRRGAGRGIGVVLVSQRSASIHKGCLSQTELMVAHQTTAPQDKDAVEKWVVAHGDEKRRDSFMKRIPALATGVAIVWSPSWLDIYEEVKVRTKETYDSSAAPRIGHRRRPPKVLAQVDLERLKRHMTETIEKAKQEDPRLLRAEVATLRTELAAAKASPFKGAAAPPRPVLAPPKPRPALAAGEARRLSALLGRVQRAVQEQREAARALGEALSKAATALSVARTPAPPPAPPLRAHARLPMPLPAPPRASHLPSDSGNGSPLDKPARAILSVLAQYPEGCLIGKLTLLAGYRRSGGFRNSLSTLRSRGLITGPNTGTMRITREGLAAVGDAYTPLPEGRALAEYWLSHPSFGQCDRKVLSALLESPQGLGMEDLAQASGYGLSGGFRNALSNLRTAGVLVGKNTETMKPSAELLG